MVPFGISNPFFKHDKPEIRHVVVILAGSGAATRDLEQLQSACIAEDLFDNLYVQKKIWEFLVSNQTGKVWIVFYYCIVFICQTYDFVPFQF